MEHSKLNKPLSAAELDQLLRAIRDIDQSVAHLRRLLRDSLRDQQDDDLPEISLPKTLH